MIMTGTLWWLLRARVRASFKISLFGELGGTFEVIAIRMQLKN